MTAAALNPTPANPAARTLPVSRAILYATLVVGVLDAADGVVFRGLQGQNPIQVLQYIASSLLGARPFSGGPMPAIRSISIAAFRPMHSSSHPRLDR
jgi:hypothetical protein